MNRHGIFRSQAKAYYNEMPEAFKKLYGFTPRKGSCKQYELTLKEIE